MNIRKGPEFTADLFGKKIIDRVSPIPVCRRSYKVSNREDLLRLEVEWQPNTESGNKGGNIGFTFCSELRLSGTESGKTPKLLTTSLSIKEYWIDDINPIEGCAAFLVKLQQ